MRPRMIPQLDPASLINDTDYFPVAQEAGKTRRAMLTMALPSRPQAGSVQELWIGQREGDFAGLGSGSRHNPLNGNGMDRFDGIMADLQNTDNVRIHLLPKFGVPYRTDAATNNGDVHNWFVRNGWELDGHGSTVQFGGDISGSTVGRVMFATPASGTQANDVVIRNLDIDLNWAELQATAAVGLGGEKNSVIMGIYPAGNRNLIENVRCRNGYGSLANSREAFTVGLRSSDPNNPGVNNVIRFCLVETPAGNYGAPYAFHSISDSQFYGNRARGLNNGTNTGYNSGGLNGAVLDNVAMWGNIFTDCFGVFYLDTGTLKRMTIFGNQAHRAWMGVGVGTVAVVQDMHVFGNTLRLQNRNGASAVYGIAISGAAGSSDLDVGPTNRIRYQTDGAGVDYCTPVTIQNFDGVRVVNNTMPTPNGDSGGLSGCTNYTLLGNRHYVSGEGIIPLPDTDPATKPNTPGQIAANTNNYNPGTFKRNAAVHRLSSDASRNLTGLTFAPSIESDGHATSFWNVGANDIVLKHQDAGSTAANRFLNSTGADITLSANQGADLIYDATAARWKVFKRN